MATLRQWSSPWPLLLHLLLLSCSFPNCHAFSRGAPTSQCQFMTPKHGFQPQVSAPIYQISLDGHGRGRRRLLVGRGQSVGVRLGAIRDLEGATFKGYILRAEDARVASMVRRDGEDEDAYQDRRKKATSFGTWHLDHVDTSPTSRPSQYLDCHGGRDNVLTHTDALPERTQVLASWAPPRNFTGFVRFRATVVKDYKTYWKNVLSSTLQVSADAIENEDDDYMLLTRRPRQQSSSGNPETGRHPEDESSRLKKRPRRENAATRERGASVLGLATLLAFLMLHDMYVACF